MTTQLQLPAVIQGLADQAAGEAAKDRGMACAEAGTPISWAQACDQAIAEMARRGIPFQAVDLVAEGLVDEPDDHHQWGVRFRVNARRGVIEEAAPAKSRRATSHASRLCTWQGVTV